MRDPSAGEYPFLLGSVAEQLDAKIREWESYPRDVIRVEFPCFHEISDEALRHLASKGFRAKITTRHGALEMIEVERACGLEP